MKTTNIALIAATGFASPAHAKLGFARDPRSVEAKEDVRRGTMGSLVTSYILNNDACTIGDPRVCQTCLERINGELEDNNKDKVSLKEDGFLDIGTNHDYQRACADVAAEFEVCVGCQGYEMQENNEVVLKNGQGMVTIPGCLNMEVSGCQAYATQILADHPRWFPHTSKFQLDQRQVTSTHHMNYYYLAIPVDGDNPLIVKSLSGEKDCLVKYPWDWCTEIHAGNTQCYQLPPFDCSADDGSGTCMTVEACCDKINGKEETEANPGTDALYIWPDINGNKLQCYPWTPNPAQGNIGCIRDSNGLCIGSPGDPASVEGELRLIVHILHNRVALPGIITAKPDFAVEADLGIALVYDEDNLNSWETDDKGLPIATESVEDATFSHELYVDKTVETYKAGSGYYAGANGAQN